MPKVQCLKNPVKLRNSWQRQERGQRKRVKLQMISIRNGKKEHYYRRNRPLKTSGSYGQCYANKFKTLGEVDIFLEKN